MSAWDLPNRLGWLPTLHVEGPSRAPTPAPTQGADNGITRRPVALLAASA